MIPNNNGFVFSTTALHSQEWQKSVVSPSIVKLNVRSLEGNDAIERLTENAIFLLGKGQKTPHSQQYVTAPAARILDRYKDMSGEGWWCSGIDVLTGKPSAWGCFKPDRPRLHGETLKPIKYEHPAKTATELFALRVTWQDGLKIAKKHGLEAEYLARMGVHLPEVQDHGFWQWVIETPAIPLGVTEGAKKAGALLTAGYCTIGLPGIYSGYRQLKDQGGNPLGLPHLIPQLAVFAVLGREFVFFYDQDTKQSTVKNVQTAIKKTGKLLRSKGCKVSVASWTDQWKGIDDLIADQGEDAADIAFENRTSLGQFCNELAELLNPSLIVNERYVPQSIDIPEDTQLIALKSPKGTGKTQWISDHVADHLYTGGSVLNITHRIALGHELSNRVGIPYRTELKERPEGSMQGYVLCLNSLHPKANPRFVPTAWPGANVVIDEVEQFLWHGVESPTCRQHREKILENLKDLARVVKTTGGKFIIADADLTQRSVNYFQALLGSDTRTFVIENIYQSPMKTPLYLCEGPDPSNLYQEAKTALTIGQKVLLMTDGQKHDSTWGTQALELAFKKAFPNRKVVRVDGESVKDKTHPAYHCTDNFNKFVQDYDLVICSPVIETGISIDCKHFDAVFGISHRVQTDNAFAQALARVRANIPRYIWRKKTSPHRYGNGSTDPLQVLAGEHFKSSSNIRALSYLGVKELPEFGFLEDDLPVSPSLSFWAKTAAKLNYEAVADESYFLSKMKKEGYEIKHLESPDKESSNEIIDEVRAAKKEVYGNHKKAVLEAESVSDAQYKTLKEKRELTAGERSQLKRARLERTYGIKVTDELITKDDDGWYPQIRLHYFLTVGKESLADREIKKLERLIKDGDGKLFLPDKNKQTESEVVVLLELLGIERFLDPEAEFTGEALTEWLERLKTPILIRQIKDILGVTLSMKDSPIRFIQRLLRKMGLKLQGLGQRWKEDGSRQRVYKGCLPDPDGRGEIFDVWLNRLKDFSEMEETAA